MHYDDMTRFIAAGVKYVREEALIEAGSASTPDVVFLDSVFINGARVHWIDSKCYYGSAGSKMFTQKLKKQIDRYDTAFNGRGAIIYKFGFSAPLMETLPQTLLLDSGPLPIYEEEEIL